MKREHVHWVALPQKDLAIRGEREPCKVIDRPGRAMFARYPLGKRECERAGLDRNSHVGVQDLSRRVRDIERDLDGRTLLCER